MISTETTDDSHLLHRIGLCQTPMQNSALIINQIISQENNAVGIFSMHIFISFRNITEIMNASTLGKGGIEISLYKTKYRIVLSHHFRLHLLIYTRKKFKISKYENLENYVNE